MNGNRTYGRLVSTTILALEDAEGNESDMQNFVYHAKDIFEAFYTDDLSPDLMRSISKMCAAALETAAEVNGEHTVSYLMGLRQQLAEADKGKDPNVDVVLQSLQKQGGVIYADHSVST